ncbi:MAG: dihydrodipicolinate reductase [Acidobacteriota bacterium]|nr:dihydrodipicolinate reductase [Acidobacteriota bacterium]
MRVGLVGDGKMGREVGAAAEARGHHVLWRLGSGANRGAAGLTSERLGSADVVFEFTAPEAAVDNLIRLGEAGSRVVCGTTGWTRELSRVTQAFRGGGGGLVHASNFSVGVRHMFDLAARAARLYGPAGYAAYLVEEHHAEKRDAPSGTARKIASLVESAMGRPPAVASVRAGTIPGTHRLVFESPDDEVEIIHRARNRGGFARGAVWAGERIAGRSGVFEFGELLEEVEKEVS